MNRQFSVLLYSEYSSHCKKILKMVQEYPLDFNKAIGLNTLCIDNENVRKRIAKSKNIKINTVPCILVIYDDGGVEKYEGSTAFGWLEEVITKLSPPPQPQIPQLPQIPQMPPMEEEIDEEVVEEVKRPPPKKQAPPKRQPPKSTKKETMIDDLDSEDEIVPQKKLLRDNHGNYIEADYGEIEEPVRETKKAIKTVSQGNKPDVLAAAQAMQKMRDMEIESAKPIGANYE
jgi:hypothetical protein